jgi:hypothetical protein
MDGQDLLERTDQWYDFSEKDFAGLLKQENCTTFIHRAIPALKDYRENQDFQGNPYH